MEYKKYPEAAVGVLVFNQKGRIFLMTSPKWRGKYTLPGGHIELGEKMQEAAKREVKEETGLDIGDIEFLNVQDCIFSDEFYKKKHFILLDFIARTKNDKAVLDGREAIECVWSSIEEALGLPLNPYTENAILEYKKKHING